MQNIKVFFNHFYFSLIAVLGCMIGLYVVLRILDVALEVVGIRLGVRDFSIGSHPWSLTTLWLAATVSWASWLTYKTIKSRPTGDVVYTRRQY
jgi:hypothetical protein